MRDMDNTKIYRQAFVLNRTEVRRRLLQYAADTRSHPFKRVSEMTLECFEARVEAMIRHHVSAHPSKGITL